LTLYSGSIQTNLTPGQLQELIEFAAGIDRDKIYAVTFDEQSIEEYFAPDGQDAIVLKPGAVQHIRERLYSLPLTPGAPTSNSPLPIAPTALPVAVATSTPMITSTVSTPQQHVVQQGDTLFSLAQRYNVTVEAIQQANQLTGDSIFAGQQLIIPTP
jgi:nucleoid-associated protein YgaU